jgi:hypothetical protein
VTRALLRALPLGIAAGAVVGVVLRFGVLLQGPRTLLAALLVAAAVTGLALLPAAPDAGSRWPPPPEPERVAGWHRVSILAGAMRTGRRDPAVRARLERGLGRQAASEEDQ